MTFDLKSVAALATLAIAASKRWRDPSTWPSAVVVIHPDPTRPPLLTDRFKFAAWLASHGDAEGAHNMSEAVIPDGAVLVRDGTNFYGVLLEELPTRERAIEIMGPRGVRKWKIENMGGGGDA